MTGAKVLILGASALQVPMIRRARELGMRTVVVDHNPLACGVPLADEFHAISTNDIPALVALARRAGIDGVTTLATDMPVRSIAAIAQALGLRGISPETALACTDKEVMAETFQRAGLPHPRFAAVTTLEAARAALERIGPPVIIKPTDSSGSRGVIQVTGPDELPEAFAYAQAASRTGRLLVEERLRGPEISCEVLCIAGSPHVVALTDKHTTGAPHFIEVGHALSARLAPPTEAAVRRLIADTTAAFGLTDGPAHIETILTDSGPRLVELGARLGGDFIASDLVPLATGVDLIGLVLRQACGEAIPVPIPGSGGAAARFLSAAPGPLAGFSGLQEAAAVPGVVTVQTWAEPGHIVTGLHSSSDRVAVVLAQGLDRDAAIASCEAAAQLITVHGGRS
ncbi:MAG: ATP-grasp domain-containing protein [Propionibacteriaceae bacterium]|nr:ATP-grasp domain-containing protein [Propionibacteriaceae bacterium]